MSELMYKQVRMTKKVKDGTLTDVAWIPSKFAVIGKYLRIKDSNGWLVETTSANERPASYVNDRSQAYKTQREGSDVKSGTREQWKRR